MKKIQLFRIETHLNEKYKGIVPMDGIPSNKSDEGLRSIFLTRAQCALGVKLLSNISLEKSANSITDGFQDNGIDAIFPDFDKKTLYLCQSKWTNNGNSTPKKSEIQSFIKGVKDLIELKFDKFNERVNLKKTEIINALKDPQFKILVVLIYTSNQPLPQESRNELQELIDENNDGYTDIFRFETITIRELYLSLIQTSENTPININEITLFNWGKHELPYESIYGEIEAEKLAELWRHYGQSLLSKNLRRYKDESGVNDVIRVTLSKKPELFWYYNNGITVLCKGIGKGAIHGNNRSAGVFSFDNVSIVNGAQTIGSIGRAYKDFPEDIKNAKVHIRFINLKDAPDNLEKDITKYNNTQNRIENKDFAALDPNQDRLKKELLLDKKLYVFRAGEKVPEKENGCTIEEATYALACSLGDLKVAVLAHTRIGQIWTNIDSFPYTAIFNTKTKALKLWRAVLINRIVKKYADSLQLIDNSKHMISVHGDSLLLHKVFEVYGRHKLEHSDPQFIIDDKEISQITSDVLDAITKVVKQLYPRIYLNSLFKNGKKVQKISNSIDTSLGLEKNLFT